VRLYNARWWCREEVEGEVAVLHHLRSRAVRVAAPVKRKDGDWVTTVRAQWAWPPFARGSATET
jgi:Ser/Thr protein kinase RdoA (MazF antagonist)